METLNQLAFSRVYTLGRLGQSNDAEWDTQPEGYNNTIRWNAGHIFVTMEYFTNLVVSEYEIVNAEWVPLFMRGTSPASWGSEIPSNEEILSALKEQPDRIVKVLEGKLSEPMAEPMKLGAHEMATVEAIIQFAIWHEGLHAGIIDGLNRTTTQS